MNKNGKAPSGALKLGGSQVVLCAAAIVIGILVNLIVGALPATATRFDLSSAGYFTLSEQSREIAASVAEPVTLYLAAETGSEDSTIMSLLERYASAGPNITVETVDPVLHPGFLKEYTDKSVSDNSVIVEGRDSFRIVDNTEIFVQDYSQYYTTGRVLSAFDGEGAITSAIVYVTGGEVPALYELQGHGEPRLPENIASLIEKDNYRLSELSLLTAESVPEDCGALIITSPQTDISEHERELIIDYMARGGHLLVFTESGLAAPNLDRVLAACGMRIYPGAVIERDGSRYFSGNYLNLLPRMEEHEITAALRSAGRYVLLPNSQGIGEADSIRGTLEFAPILTTSSSSYLRSLEGDWTTAEKLEGDRVGPITVGLSAREQTPGGEMRAAVYGTATMLADGADQVVSGANGDLVLNTLGWLCDYDIGMSIHPKTVDADVLTVPAASVNLISVALTVLLPLLVLSAGAYVTVSRRRR